MHIFIVLSFQCLVTQFYRYPQQPTMNTIITRSTISEEQSQEVENLLLLHADQLQFKDPVGNSYIKSLKNEKRFLGVNLIANEEPFQYIWSKNVDDLVRQVYKYQKKKFLNTELQNFRFVVEQNLSSLKTSSEKAAFLKKTLSEKEVLINASAKVIKRAARNKWIYRAFCQHQDDIISVIKWNYFKDTAIKLTEEIDIGEISSHFTISNKMSSDIFTAPLLLKQIGYLQDELTKLSGGDTRSQDRPKKKKGETVTAKEIGIFCVLTNFSTVRRIGLNEGQEDYCRRICEEFNLPYTDNVRQAYGSSSNLLKLEPARVDKITKLMLPDIQIDVREKIRSFIEEMNN